MPVKAVADGTVHKMPADFKKALISSAKALAAWEDITQLARNEFICWVMSAKKDETKLKRIDWACKSLADGKRRPCCWQGCPHR